MGAKFWIKRFAVVLGGAFAIIFLAQLLRGHDLPYAATQGAMWGAIAASVFAVARIYQSRRKQHCAICRDTPEMQQIDRGSDG